MLFFFVCGIINKLKVRGQRKTIANRMFTPLFSVLDPYTQKMRQISETKRKNKHRIKKQGDKRGGNRKTRIVRTNESPNTGL